MTNECHTRYDFLFPFILHTCNKYYVIQKEFMPWMFFKSLMLMHCQCKDFIIHNNVTKRNNLWLNDNVNNLYNISVFQSNSFFIIEVIKLTWTASAAAYPAAWPPINWRPVPNPQSRPANKAQTLPSESAK